MQKKKTWTEKLKETKQSKIKRIDFNFADIPANSNMFIATPQLIQNYLQQIPAGTTTSVQTMRKDLAIAHGADYTCPVTTGIFLRIVAEAAFERYEQTKSWEGVAPFWRVIQPNTNLAKKLSFGEAFIVQQQQAENIST